jgi:hypothetical protein
MMMMKIYALVGLEIAIEGPKTYGSKNAKTLVKGAETIVVVGDVKEG